MKKILFNALTIVRIPLSLLVVVLAIKGSFITNTIYYCITAIIYLLAIIGVIINKNSKQSKASKILNIITDVVYYISEGIVLIILKEFYLSLFIIMLINLIVFIIYSYTNTSKKIVNLMKIVYYLAPLFYFTLYINNVSSMYSTYGAAINIAYLLFSLIALLKMCKSNKIEYK